MPASERRVTESAHCAIDIMTVQQSTGVVSRKTLTSAGANSRSSPRTADSPRVAASTAASEDEHDSNTHNSTQQPLVSSSSSVARSAVATSDVIISGSGDCGDRNGNKSKHCERPAIVFLRTRIAVLCLLLVSAVVGLITAQSYFNGQPDIPGCAMSYSRPRFVEQTKFDNSWTRFSTKYKLYLYREGGYDAHDEAFRIPILFVPGNAGSHKQVRSIASASATAFMELANNSPDVFDRGQIGYDYFTVGLNEELTALHGYSILEQADFINDAIRYILSLYPETRAKYRLPSQGTRFALPTSVVVVGHSMGGVVARTAFTLPNHIVGSVQAIFTLSTPHNNPTASLEYYVDKVYSSVNSFWRHGFHNGTLDDVSLVSIAGGNLDSMINSDYTYIGDLAPPKNSLSILSSGVDDVWLSLDHQSILWCAQMAKKFSSMLIQIMDARQPSQLLPLDERMSIMRRQLYSDWERGANAAPESLATNRTTNDDYSYVYVHRDGAARLVPEDMQKLLSGDKTNNAGLGVALHLLPVNRATSNSTAQLVYDPRLFATALASGSIAVYQPVLLGCNRIKVVSNSAKPETSVTCQTIPAPLPTKLPMRRADDDPELPLYALHYMEVPVSVLEQFEFLGMQLPAKPGVAGFFHATIVKDLVQLESSPSYVRLLHSLAIRTPTTKSRIGSSTRTRIRLNVPESPFFVFRGTLTMRRNTSSSQFMSAAPRFRPIIRQSDGRWFESRFWYDQDTVDFAIHGRGAYLPSDVITNAEDSELKSAGQWDGLFIDVWADPDYYVGFELTLRINWYSSLNRTIKRYDMALLAMSFVWACLVMLHQLRTWNAGVSLETTPSPKCRGSLSTPAFPSCLTSIERLIRNGTLSVLLVAAVLTPILQRMVAYLMGNVWSPATLASWNNLFMGTRGSGWVLGLVPALLVIVSLGFVALEAIVLTAICSLASWAMADVSGRFESTQKHWSRHDVLEAVSEDGRLKPRFVKIPVRPLIATVAFVVFVCTFVPYQFAFLVIYMAQLFTAIRTMSHAYLAAPHSASSLTPQRLLVSDVLRDRARYQLGLLLFWTSSLPYCAPELLVWVRNLSVLWFEDAPSDHNLANMAGYFALRLLASYHIVPRLTFTATERAAPSRTAWWLRVMTYVFFGSAVVYAWLYSIRRPYILYSVANAISAWLALVQFAEFPLRLVSPVQRRVLSSSALLGSRTSSPAVTPVSSPEVTEFPVFARSVKPLATASRSNDQLDRKLR
ncbi:GPI inositol deacylase [Coemansia sp. S680]|nr:GPI inositol deacylase [Coemansia sp. S680]